MLCLWRVWYDAAEDLGAPAAVGGGRGIGHSVVAACVGSRSRCVARCAATRGAVLRRWSGLCARFARGEGGRTSLLVRLSVAMIEADEPDAVGPASSTRSCRICRSTYKTGTSGHNTKNCALNDMHCRAQEPPTSPYHVTGPCLSGSCSHNMKCTVCHKLGHSNTTQRYTPIR